MTSLIVDFILSFHIKHKSHALGNRVVSLQKFILLELVNPLIKRFDNEDTVVPTSGPFVLLITVIFVMVFKLQYSSQLFVHIFECVDIFTIEE